MNDDRERLKPTEVKIVSDVPLPGSIQGSRSYPWDQMKVGDSFFLPNRIHNAVTLPIRLVRQGWAITRRTEGNGVRVWRIK